MAFVLLILIVVLAMSFFAKIHALGLLIFLMIVHGTLVTVFGASASSLPMLASVLVLSIAIARRTWVPVPLFIWIVMFWLLTFVLLAALTGLDPRHSRFTLILYAKGFVLAFLVSGSVKDEAEVRLLSLYCLLAVSVGSCMALYQHFTGTYTINVSWDIQRAGGLRDDPNETAMLLLIGIPLAAYWFMRSETLAAKVLFAVVFVLTVGGIALTQSRGAGVTLALVLLLMYLKRPTTKALIAGLALVVVGLFLSAGTFLERMETLSTEGTAADESLSLRLQFMIGSLELIFQNPVFGVGLGNWGLGVDQIRPDIDIGSVRAGAAHNMYLEFFAENGVIAGFLFLALLGIAVISSLQYDRYYSRERSSYGLGFCFSMSLLTILISGLFLSIGEYSVLWFFIGVGFAFAKMSANSRTVDHSNSASGNADRSMTA